MIRIGIGIGEPGLWGRHIGREALELEVRYLFDEMRLHRIGLSVVSHNDRHHHRRRGRA